jgi:hypothetical protein
VRARPIALVDDDDVGDLEQARLDGLDLVAHVGRLYHHRCVGSGSHLHLALACADRLDQHDVETHGIEERRRSRGGRRQPTRMAARGHRPDEHPVVGGVGLHADAITEDGAAGDGAGWIDGHNGHRPSGATKLGDE